MQNWEEKTSLPGSLFITIEKKTLSWLLSCKFCKAFTNINLQNISKWLVYPVKKFILPINFYRFFSSSNICSILLIFLCILHSVKHLVTQSYRLQRFELLLIEVINFACPLGIFHIVKKVHSHKFILTTFCWRTSVIYFNIQISELQIKWVLERQHRHMGF